jgi:DNA polymerase III subunit gamma/tau
VARGQVLGVLDALASADGAQLLVECDRIASFSPDFGGVLDDLAVALHRIQLIQLIPGYRPDESETEGGDVLAALAQRLGADDVQLYYQIAVNGRRDLPLAPDARTGFEMALLRMLAFGPAEAVRGAPVAARAPAEAPRLTTPPPERNAGRPEATPMATRAPAAAPSVPPSAPVAAAAPVPAAAAAMAIDARGLPHWDALIERAGLRGPLGQLAQNAALRERDGNTLVLALQPLHMHLAVEPMVSQMEERIGQALGERIRLRFVSTSDGDTQTPAARAANAREASQAAAEQAIEDDPLVQSLKREFGARVVPQSVKPFDPATR